MALLSRSRFMIWSLLLCFLFTLFLAPFEVFVRDLSYRMSIKPLQWLDFHSMHACVATETMIFTFYPCHKLLSHFGSIDFHHIFSKWKKKNAYDRKTTVNNLIHFCYMFNCTLVSVWRFYNYDKFVATRKKNIQNVCDFWSELKFISSMVAIQFWKCDDLT